MSKRKKISKYFEPKSCMYKYKGMLFDYQPDKTDIAYYVWDDELSIYVAVCNKLKLLMRIVYLISVIACIIVIAVSTRSEYTIQFSNTLQSDGEYLYLNLISDKTNISSGTIKVVLDSEELIEPFRLQSGQSVGVVKLKRHLDSGSYNARLICSVYKFPIYLSKEYKVLIYVKE